MKQAVVSLNITPEQIQGALVFADADVTAHHAVSPPFGEGSEAVTDTILAVAKRVIDMADDISLLGISLSLDGLVDDDTLIHTESELQCLQGFPLREMIEQHFQSPARLENSVNAMALTEAHLGAGSNCESLMYLYADASLGGAFVYQGRIWHGSHAGAGQIGYLLAGWMSQKAISLNQRASGAGIATQYNMRSRKFRIPALDEIIQYANQGDQLAIRVIRDGANVFGKVLSPVVGLIDPEQVVIGGKLAATSGIWWNEFERALRDNPLPALQHIQIVSATMPDHAALIGATLPIFHAEQ